LEARGSVYRVSPVSEFGSSLRGGFGTLVLGIGRFGIGFVVR